MPTQADDMDMAAFEGGMQKMGVKGNAAGREEWAAERAKHKSTKKKLILIIAACIAVATLFATVATVRELQWRGKIAHVKAEADTAIAGAAVIASRHHHGKDVLQEDISALATLLNAGKNIDATISENVERTSAASGESGAKAATDESAALTSKKTFGIEGAIGSVVKSIEMDVAQEHGHPLLLKDGVPMDKTNQKIAKLAGALLDTEKAIDEGQKESEGKAATIASLTSSSDDAEIKKKLKEEVADDESKEKELGGLEAKLVDAITATAAGAR